MIPPDLAARIRLLNQELTQESTTPRVEALHRITPVSPATSELPSALQEGQRFQATIQRPLPNGTFLALVANQEMTLAMDRPLKAGDTLELVVMRREGNQVWAREASAPATSSPPQVSSSNPAAQTQFSQTAALLRQLITTAEPRTPLPVSVASPPSLSAARSNPLPTPQPTATPPPPAHSPMPAQSTAAQQAPPVAQSHTPAQPISAQQVALRTLTSLRTPPESPAQTGQTTAHNPATSPTLARYPFLAALQNLSENQPVHVLLRSVLSPVDARLQQNHAPLVPSQLADTVRQSGLFYESHLARWVQGSYPITELQAEPQTQRLAIGQEATIERDRAAVQSALASAFVPLAASAQAATPRSTSPTDKLLALVQRLLGVELGNDNVDNNPATASTRATPGAAQTSPAGEATETTAQDALRQSSATSAAQTPIPERLLPLVQRQLDALAFGRVDLLFSAWLGTEVRWEISDENRDSRHSGSESDEPAPMWRSKLTIDSETLGKIAFWVEIAPHGIQVAIAAASEETATLLKARMHELLAAFANDELPVQKLEWRPFVEADAL
ncbi:flagellar hook-length control protein FliK [Hydrogenophilus thiooxidans]|uniref:flagellar hook-length control protein FliK n=1 Tax=Hydrogenophilus thiooxidans TaxID=2820326 RepID=UPI001C23C347|nr:flagellar hook-length control protein FliK [Hydrogenophilus thiooxidans]